MKRKLLSMIVLLMTAAMSAVAQLYAPPGGGGIGDEKTITLTPNILTLTVGEEETVSYSLSGMAMVIPSWRITEGNSYIDLPIGPGNSKTVKAKAPGTAIIECYATDWTSGYCTVTVNPANVTLTDGNDLSALSTYAGLTIDVAYSRSFTNGKPSTVCLPFAYTKKTGDGSFYEFTNIEKNGSGEYVATMTDPGVSMLTANTPYLYMPNATGAVDFSGTYTIPATLTAGETTSNGWTFKGTYTTITWSTAPTGTYGFSASDYSGGISQGQFVKVGTNVSIKPMRCYLVYGDGSTDYAGAPGMNRAASAGEQLPATIKVRLINANGELTAIGSLQTKTGEVTLDGDAWYTVDGRRMEGKPSTKGIYINNNKKVIIK